MHIEIKVPRMGESITEATIGEIIIPPGSFVNADDELLELETDKVNQVLYAPQKGTFNLKVSPGDVVKIEDVIGYIDTEATAPVAIKKKNGNGAEKKSESAKKTKESEQKEIKQTAHTESVGQVHSGSVRFSKEDFISSVRTGDKKEEVGSATQTVGKTQTTATEQVASRPSSRTSQNDNPLETRKKMSKIRKVIAARLVEAQQTTAMLTTFNEVDMTQVILLREKYKELFLKQYKVKLGFMSFFVKACVTALRAFPDINSYIDGDDIVHREYYHIGIAVASERGLVVPVIRDCDQLSFAGVESAIERYAKKANEGALEIDDLQGGGFTITNGGVFGSLLSTPILNPPQSAILGMHKIAKRAVVVEDQIVIRPMMYLALSYDHRIVDGKEAVSFLVNIKNSLEDPSRLLLDIN